MSLTQLLNRSCTITRRHESGNRDEFGNDTPSEGTVSTVCELQQRQRNETPDGQVARATWLLILPGDAVLASGDTVTVDQVVYEVHGDPWPARNPSTGAAHHLEATVVLAGSVDEGAARAS